MILVPSRLQQLSGSRLLLWSCLLMLITSCGTQKKVTSTTRSNTRTTTSTRGSSTLKKRTRKPVKTIDWTVENSEEKPPIGAPKVVKAKKKGDYSITCLIPFDANKASSVDLSNPSSSESKFISYYAGMKMASEDHQPNSSISINVLDASNVDVESLANSGQLDSDIIVGPYDSGDLKIVASHAEYKKSMHISPWKSSTKIANDNPYHIQTRPSLIKHYNKMVEDAVSRYPSADLYVLGQNKGSDLKRMDYMEKTAKSLGRPNITKYTVEKDSLLYGELVFDNMFDTLKTSVVMIPNWSANDESFIYNIVRKLRIEKGSAKVIVYGMPKMMDTDKITYDFYNNLNVHVVRSEFTDLSSPTVMSLRRRFFETYNTFPSTEFYEGYDMMTFLLNNLDKYGQNFQLKLGKDRHNYIQTSYDIVGVPKSGSEPSNDPDKIKYYENIALKVVKFQNGKFREQ